MGENLGPDIRPMNEEDTLKKAGIIVKDIAKSLIKNVGATKEIAEAIRQSKHSVADSNPSNADENGNVQLSEAEVKAKLEEKDQARQKLALEKEQLANEQAVYNLYKKMEYTFQAEIQPLISVFHRILDELIYFAGCQTEANYEGRKTILLNKQELLRNGIQNRMRGQGISFEGIDRMEQTFKEIESCHADRDNVAKVKQERAGLEVAKKVDVEEETKKYITENKKLRMDESRQRQCLEYVCLLKAFYPIVEEICNQETMDAQWTCGIAEQLEKVVAEQQCEFSTNMKFCWVHPDDDVVQQSKQLQIQFRAAEVDCPGLYYRDSDRQNQYVCVVPGCAK